MFFEIDALPHPSALSRKSRPPLVDRHTLTLHVMNRSSPGKGFVAAPRQLSAPTRKKASLSPRVLRSGGESLLLEPVTALTRKTSPFLIHGDCTCTEVPLVYYVGNTPDPQLICTYTENSVKILPVSAPTRKLRSARSAYLHVNGRTNQHELGAALARKPTPIVIPDNCTYTEIATFDWQLSALTRKSDEPRNEQLHSHGSPDHGRSLTALTRKNLDLVLRSICTHTEINLHLHETVCTNTEASEPARKLTAPIRKSTCSHTEGTISEFHIVSSTNKAFGARMYVSK